MITILHLTDLHATADNEFNIKQRVGRVFDDITREGHKPDLLIFSGDLAYGGRTSEFELAGKLLLEGVRTRLQIPNRRCIFVPGNHDVDRALIEEIDDAGTATICQDPDKASKLIQSNLPAKRLEAYHRYVTTNYEIPNSAFYTKRFSISGVNIGIAGLNSAWRAGKDKGRDKGLLHLTQFQVNSAADELEGALIKIAVVHHPFDWFHPSEEIAIADLKRRFHIVLTGHIHTPKSALTVTPSDNSLVITAKALFDGEDIFEGYNVYRIELKSHSLQAFYRKFIRRRGEYDKDTDHAPNGEMVYPLPSAIRASGQLAVLAHQCAVATTRLEEEVVEELRLFQQADQPVYVVPKVLEASRTPEHSKRAALVVQPEKLLEGGCLLIGSSEAGKSVFLKRLASEHNQHSSTASAVYVDFARSSSVSTRAELLSQVAETLSISVRELPRNILFIGDHVEKAPPLLPKNLSDVAREFDWKLILSTNNKYFQTALLASEEFSRFAVYEIAEWGPSRIREYLRESFKGKSINIDAAFAFITSSLAATDLPATPVIVTLYASVFPKLGGQVTSLSFVRLLELVEQRRLEANEKDESYGFYNKREALILLARRLWRTGFQRMPSDVFKQELGDYFSSKYLDLDANILYQKLLATQVIDEADGKVGFVWYSFWDFYLAQAFQRRNESIDLSTQKIEDCILITESLALYGGLVRNDYDLIMRVLSHVEKLFGDRSPATLSDLDSYIKMRLLPKHDDSEADALAQKHLEESVDYEEQDPDFHLSRRNYKKKRQSVAQIIPATANQVERLRIKSSALRTFYNIFRNLEHLDGPKKVELLDKVLNLHIACNFDLIDLYCALDPNEDFKSLSAYGITIAGQMFLANEVGNQTLSRAIVEAINASQNDFKKLLLTCLYVDLRLVGYLDRLEALIDETTCVSAMEILYLKTTQLLVCAEGKSLPVTLLAVFKKAFQRRNRLFGEKEPLRGYAKVVERIKAGRTVLLGSKWSDNSGD